MKNIILKKDKWILFCTLTAYFVNKYYICKIFMIPVLRNHLNDYIGGIVFSAVINILSIFWLGKRITPKNCLLVTVFAALYWEYVAPLYISYSVKDVKDIVAYLIGSISYLYVNRKSYEKWKNMFHDVEILEKDKKI